MNRGLLFGLRLDFSGYFLALTGKTGAIRSVHGEGKGNGVDGGVFDITHRYHNREFLLKFAHGVGR